MDKEGPLSFRIFAQKIVAEARRQEEALWKKRFNILKSQRTISWDEQYIECDFCELELNDDNWKQCDFCGKTNCIQPVVKGDVHPKWYRCVCHVGRFDCCRECFEEKTDGIDVHKEECQKYNEG